MKLSLQAILRLVPSKFSAAASRLAGGVARLGLAGQHAHQIRVLDGGVAEDANDVLHKLLTMGDDRNVKAVFVGGKKLV